MQSNTATQVRVATARATTAKQRRIEERAERLTPMVVSALRTALYAAKKGETRHPYPEPRGQYSEVLRTHSRPLEKFGCMVAGLIEDGLDHADARVLCSVLTEWCDSEMSGDLPPLSQLTPRLAIENGEAVAAAAVAMHSPCIGNIDRALIEGRQAVAVNQIYIARLASDRRNGEDRRGLGCAR